MQTFSVNELTPLNEFIRTGTPGFQPKFTVGDKFIKQQCCMNGQFRDDYKVEVFASGIGEILNIPVIKQEACKIIYPNAIQYGVVSTNLEVTQNAHFCSFKYLMERSNVFVDTDKLRHMSTIAKIQYFSELYNKATGISTAVAERYLIDTAIIDSLVCNPDRHMRNFGAWLYGNGKVSLYPIFDNGLGFGQWVTSTSYYQTYEDYLREAYIAPYGEEPIEMLRLLEINYKVVSNRLYPKLKQLKALGKIGYPCDFAKQHYHNVLKFIEDIK